MGIGGIAYGIARGSRDANRDEMEAEGFQTDQAIRRARLQNEQHTAARLPQVEAQQDILTQLGIDAATLNLKDRQELEARATKARAQEDRLKLGLGKFHASGDPQHVADAMAEMYPDQKGKPTARRSGENIQLLTTDPDSGEEKVVHEFKPEDINGRVRSADDQLSMYAYKFANPVETLKAEHGSQLKVEGEAAKQEAVTERALERERIRNEGALTRERARGDKASGKAAERGKKLGKSYLDSSLKTVSVPGHFSATYSSEDDAKLLPHMYKAMGANVDADMEPEAAAQKAIEDVRTSYLGLKKQTLEAAAKLQKAGVDPRDPNAVKAAKDAGNTDVDAYLAALGAVKQKYGADVGNYTLELVPAKKR